MVTIKIILGSTRPNRFSPQPAQWILELAKGQKDVKFELVDLEKIGLPLLDEPTPPLMQSYTNQHAKDWAKLVDKADGFIFITPEYNHSIPGALKNAIDFAAKEWYHKPAAFVSYGAEAGGVRAVEHLRAVAGYLKMYDLGEFVILPNYWTQLDGEGKFQPTDAQTESAKKLIEAMVFWTKQFQRARQELAA